MTRPWLLRVLAVLLMAGLAALVVHRTEWVDEEIERPARGAAADDPNYALGRLVRGFGARFEHRRNLEALPPPGATLLLESGLWDLFPERRAQLRHWVESGGHLVVHASDVEGDGLGTWVPLRWHDPASDRKSCPVRPGASAPRADAGATSDTGEAGDDDEDAPTAEGDARHVTPAPAHASAPAPKSPRDLAPRRCVAYVEPAGVPPAVPGRHVYQLCHYASIQGLFPTRGVTPQWSLRGDGRSLAMRVAVGRGTVTATSLLEDSNGAMARDDNAALMAALLQLHPGQDVWDIDDESQPVLALWLWDRARPVLVFAALAIAAWLWRRSVRFGPRVAEPEAARRSIGDQVAGVAGFLRHHEPAALHRAARRALESLARQHLADFDPLDDTGQARAIAGAAGLDVASLQAAMRPGPLSKPAQWLAATATLEHARRALREAVRPPARGSP